MAFTLILLSSSLQFPVEIYSYWCVFLVHINSITFFNFLVYNSHFVNFPLRLFLLCQHWPNGNWQNGNWRSGKLTKWELTKWKVDQMGIDEVESWPNGNWQSGKLTKWELTKWELTKWELTKWKVDEVGINLVWLLLLVVHCQPGGVCMNYLL